MTHSLWSRKEQARDLPAWMCGSGSGSISKGSGAKRVSRRRSLLTWQTSTRPISAGVERGKRNPTVTVLQRIAEALGADIEDLVSKRQKNRLGDVDVIRRDKSSV